MPASEIAKKVLLSRDAVAYRIRSLEEKKVILGYMPVLNLRAFGFSQFHVFFLLDEKHRAEHKSFIDYLVNHTHTRSVKSYTDTWDIEWNIIAKDLFSFDKILTEVCTKFPHVILDKERLAVIRKYVSSMLPGHSAQTALVQPEVVADIDEKDRAILASLAKNARQSSYELSRALGMNADTILYRLKNLVSSGIITGYTVLCNLSVFNYSWYSYVISFQKFDSSDEAKLASFAIKHPHIMRAVKLYGSWDVMLSIVADSPRSYHTIVKEVKNEFSDIIHRYETWLVHEEYCYVPVPRVILAANPK